MTIGELLKAKNNNVIKLIPGSASKKKDELLFKAVKNRNYKEIRNLIKSGLNVNAKDRDGYTPLMFAAQNNDSMAIELLLNLGAAIDLKNDDEETALMVAVYNDAEEAEEILIKNGANIALKDKHGRTVYGIAHDMHYSIKKEYFRKRKISVEAWFKIFLLSKYLKIGYGTTVHLQQLKEAFYEKCSISLELEVIKHYLKDVTIRIFSNTHEYYEIKWINESEIQFLPIKKGMDAFFDNFFGSMDVDEIVVYTYSEISNAFEKEFNVCMIEDNLVNYVSRVNKNPTEHGYLIEQLPKDIYIRKPLKNGYETNSLIFDTKIPQIIPKTKLNQLNINQINEKLQECGLVFHQKEHNPEEFVLTINEFSARKELCLLLRKQFLEETIGYDCSIESFIQHFEQEYEITINIKEVEQALEEANADLIDIKIDYIPNENKLKSDFKYRNREHRSITDEEAECPICKNIFPVKHIKTHVIYEHTSSLDYCSILKRIEFTEDINNCVYCYHCKKKPKFDVNNPRAILLHINGVCKSSKTGISNSTNNTVRVWNGAAYADNSEFLGNSGQIIREHGRFGSYPSEDYYGHGE